MSSVVERTIAEIRGAGSRDDVIAIGGGLPAIALSLSADKLDGELIATTLSEIVDALTEKLIEESVSDLGPAPTSWAWLQLGSLGRRDRAIAGDQDHALVYQDANEAAEHYFAALADEVVVGLERAGIPRCPSNVMASHPGYRKPMNEWIDRLRLWMVGSEPSAFYTEIALDYRRVAGTLDGLVPALDQLARSAQHHLPFLRRLARLATSQHPPLGLFGHIEVEGIGGNDDVFDIKNTALLPVTELARFFALERGIVVPSTYERLRRIAEADSEWAKSAKALGEAHRLLQNVRFEHQLRQVARRAPVDNLVAPSEFGSATRHNVTESLRVIRRVQAGVQNWIDWTA